jgi:5-methylcytosine-specific restriction endonuclease McrA
MDKTKSKWDSKGFGFDTDFYRRKDWLTLRKRIFELSPICELSAQHGIIRPTAVIDHIIPRRILQYLELEPDNLQGLSEQEHHNKSGLERNIQTLEEFIRELVHGKLQYVCTPEKKARLLLLLKEKGLM